MRTLDVVLDLGEGGGHCSDEKGAVLIVHRIMFLFRTFFACRAELLCDVYVLRFSGYNENGVSLTSHTRGMGPPPAASSPWAALRPPTRPNPRHRRPLPPPLRSLHRSLTPIRASRPR